MDAILLMVCLFVVSLWSDEMDVYADVACWIDDDGGCGVGCGGSGAGCREL